MSNCGCRHCATNSLPGNCIGSAGGIAQALQKHVAFEPEPSTPKDDARFKIEAWGQDYNRNHLQDSKQDLTPHELAQQDQHKQSEEGGKLLF